MSDAPSLPRGGKSDAEHAENRARLMGCTAAFHRFTIPPAGGSTWVTCEFCAGSVHPISASFYNRGVEAGRRAGRIETMGRVHAAVDRMLG